MTYKFKISNCDISLTISPEIATYCNERTCMDLQ